MRFKGKLAQQVFRRASSQSRIPRQTVAISNAKSIGILYDATHLNQVSVIKKFVDSLRNEGKSVTIFGYYNKRKLPLDFNPSVSNEVITRSDLNWYGVPHKKSYAMMANEPFDLLLNLCTWHCVPLLVVSAASKAKFRIGKYFSDTMNCFDFMLHSEGNTPVENFLKQIEFFSAKMMK